MAIDDDDFLDDFDDEDATPDPVLRPGVLSVPGTAKSQAEFNASAAGYRAAFPILIIDRSDDEGERAEIWIAADSLEALRNAGWRGSTIASAEDFLRPTAASPTAQPKGTHHGPPRSPDRR